MSYAVSEEVKNRTTRCLNNFRCSSNGDVWTACHIVNVIGEFLEIDKCQCAGKQCSYLMPYGSSYYCLCPTRNEIYKNYSI